jgi:hypothetical protein
MLLKLRPAEGYSVILICNIPLYGAANKNPVEISTDRFDDSHFHLYFQR